MPFIERDSKKENMELERLVQESAKSQKVHDEFMDNYYFRKALVAMRKEEQLSQKQLSQITGLTQQSISKIETGKGNVTLETVFRYLDGIGCKLLLQRKKETV